MDFLKSIIPDDWYLRFFPPEEDTKENIKLYLHVRDGKYIIPVKHGLTRSDVVSLLKDINSESGNITDQEDDTQQIEELQTKMNEVFDIPADTIYRIVYDTFSGAEILFVGGGELSIEHDKDPATNIWNTWFSKKIKNENRRVACITTTKVVKW